MVTKTRAVRLIEIEIKSRFEIARFLNRFIARFFSAPQPPAVCYPNQSECSRTEQTGHTDRYGAFPLHGTARHGTVRYGSLLGGFPLGTVPGTWYFFSTTSVEVPSSRTVTKTWRVNSADHWLAGENRHYCITELATTRPSSTALPARFKSAQPAKDRTQLLFKQTHIFASTTK